MEPALLEAISDVGFGALLIGVLIGGFRGWWIYGPLHDRQVADLVADRDFWRNMALGSLRVADRTTEALPGVDRDA